MAKIKLPKNPLSEKIELEVLHITVKTDVLR